VRRPNCGPLRRIDTRFELDDDLARHVLGGDGLLRPHRRNRDVSNDYCNGDDTTHNSTDSHF
jgi:hypothetical protein